MLLVLKPLEWPQLSEERDRSAKELLPTQLVTGHSRKETPRLSLLEEPRRRPLILEPVRDQRSREEARLRSLRRPRELNRLPLSIAS